MNENRNQGVDVEKVPRPGDKKVERYEPAVASLPGRDYPAVIPV